MRIFFVLAISLTVFFGAVLLARPEKVCSTQAFHNGQVITHKTSGDKAIVVDVMCTQLFVDTGKKAFWTYPVAWDIN